MTTTAINNTTASTNQIQNAASQLNANDFIQMMVTQLQNQDPLSPDSNSELLSQMSQIGQLQSTTELQASLKTLVLQDSLGSAGNLIGKMVQGLDDNGAKMSGMVNSVQVQDGNVVLQLDSGNTLELSKLTSITNPTATTATAGK